MIRFRLVIENRWRVRACARRVELLVVRRYQRSWRTATRAALARSLQRQWLKRTLRRWRYRTDRTMRSTIRAAGVRHIAWSLKRAMTLWRAWMRMHRNSKENFSEVLGFRRKHTLRVRLLAWVDMVESRGERRAFVLEAGRLGMRYRIKRAFKHWLSWTPHRTLDREQTVTVQGLNHARVLEHGLYGWRQATRRTARARRWMLLATKTLRRKHLRRALVSLLKHALLSQRAKHASGSGTKHHWNKVMGKRMKQWRRAAVGRRVMRQMEMRGQGWWSAFSKLRALRTWITTTVSQCQSKALAHTASLAISHMVIKRCLQSWRLVALSQVRVKTGLELAEGVKHRSMLTKAFSMYRQWTQEVQLEFMLVGTHWCKMKLRQGLRR